MLWDRREFLGASFLTAAALPYRKALGAVHNATSDLILDFEDAGGSINNSGNKNCNAFSSAVSYLSRRGGGTLVIPKKTYPFSGNASCSATNVTVSGYGATFAGPNCLLTIGKKSTGYNIEGLTLLETSGSQYTYLLDCYGSGCHFKDVHLEKAPAAGGYIALCEANTAGNIFENFSFAGSNGVRLEGHDHQIIGGWAEAAGGDDCWALKAANAPCYNIRISGFQARHFAALVSIGSEIGLLKQDDPSRSSYVRDIVVENCSAEECVWFAYLKPGGVEAYDYRDGLVENISILNCSIQDGAGTYFRNGVYVSPGRGAIVRGLTVDGLTVSARGASPAMQSVTGVYLFPLNTTDGAGNGASIDNVSITRLQCTDPFGGAPTGPSTPGTPLHSLIAMEKMNPAIGDIGRVDVSDSWIDGCARMGVNVGANASGPLTIANCSLKNFAAAPLAGYDEGSVLAQSPIQLTNITATASPGAPAGTRGVLADANPDKTIEYSGDLSPCSIGTIPAGTPVTSPIYSAVRDTWISKVEIRVDQPIAADVADFVTFTLRNGGTGEVLASVSTGNGFSLPAGAVCSMGGTVQFSGPAACLMKGAELVMEISHGGQGAAVVNPSFTVHCVPFGVA